ncbi:glycosyltransferase family 2 protein [Marinicella sp. S1101]|uniref:glycosyltransferase family 2 protein n=1 Tax=Marinicella marina TaxID=2996016 RepID=UPI002260D11E|nr:glycosyltransferase family 2 protein [Marinicella marina]MCX7554557.1 glycosyltransferase family 2 protein [Marinicella marina]MDJ1141059.1 glycosyltransferase family 2 protein [Marinicella marina]
MPKINSVSAVVTSFNSEKTIEKCLASLSWADEIIVLDSYSEDETLNIIEKFPQVRLEQQAFKGFSQQKQDVIDMAVHDWVMLLDADECLTPKAITQLGKWQNKPAKADGYNLPRIEWVFWHWAHPWVKRNEFIRLFNRKKSHMSQDLVHESIKVDGVVKKIYAPFKHYGETSIQVKLDKINRYSALAAQQKFNRGKRCSPLRLFLYPPFYFFRQFIIKRQIFNGVAGVINATLNSYYAYLKYAKLYELQQNKD